jgi:hypothetical protein
MGGKEVNARGGEGRIWRGRRFTKGNHSTGFLFSLGALLDLQRGEWSSGVGRFSAGAPVCWRFWARGPGYPYDILELGSCPSWQGG